MRTKIELYLCVFQVQLGVVHRDVRGADECDGGVLHGHGQRIVGQQVHRRNDSAPDRFHSIKAKGEKEHKIKCITNGFSSKRNSYKRECVCFWGVPKRSEVESTRSLSLSPRVKFMTPDSLSRLEAKKARLC